MIHPSVLKPLNKVFPDTKMDFHSSQLKPSFEPSATLYGNTIHERLEHAMSIPVNTRRLALNPLGLGGRIKNGLRAVLKLPPELSLGSESDESSEESLLDVDVDRDEGQAFSPIGASKGKGAVRLALARTPSDAVPSTVVWPPASQHPPIWGQWSNHTFSHCISVLTEHDARDAYVFGDEPLPPVYESTMDCVEHLWLVVPSRPSADGQMQMTEDQMRAAVKFYERACTATIIATDPEKEEEAMDNCGWGGNDAGYRTEMYEEGAVLLSCADGNEVDAVALAVLLLAHQSFGYDHSPCMRDEHGGSSGPAYHASRLIDDDPGVSYVWKGLLGWQDVEGVQAALW
jgi:hypothetical protein